MLYMRLYIQEYGYKLFMGSADTVVHVLCQTQVCADDFSCLRLSYGHFSLQVCHVLNVGAD